MAVKKRKGIFYIYFRPFKDKQIGVRLDATTKTEAQQIEAILTRACRTGDYSTLDAATREVAARMFVNQNWELPAELGGHRPRTPQEELTFWKASELFLKYPEVHAAKSKWRYECCLLHLSEKLGDDRPLKEIRIPDLKAYQLNRTGEGAAAATVNYELSTLSRVFGVMVELDLVDSNPVRMVKRLSTKSGERQVYLSLQDVQRIVDRCPAWFRPIVWVAYYAGMRRGEILGLTRKQVNLSKRIIVLSPEDTKEAHWKRVPIHVDLIPVFEESLKVTSIGTDKVFLFHDKQGVRPLELETFKNPWPRACEALEKAELLKKPWPRFHDLRHTWRTNARRSGVDSQIAESVLGHWFRGKSVNDRYGRVSDQELVDAIDRMTFDHGDTEILVASEKAPKKNCEQIVNKEPKKRKRPRCCVTLCQ